MYSIVDSIQIQSLSTSCDTFLIFTCTLLSIFTFLQVSFCIPNTVTQQFCKFRSMFSFFPSIAFESFSNFRITFTVSLTAHSQIHTNFCTFTHKVVVQIFNHFFVTTFSNTNHVLVSKFQTTFCFYHFVELRSGCFTQRTLFRSCITFMNITTNCTNKLFHNFLFY